MTTPKNPEADAKAAVRRLGVGFIKKMRDARSTIHDMKSIAEKHGRCIPPCEIPGLADYLEGVEKQLDWYLDSLLESSAEPGNHPANKTRSAVQVPGSVSIDQGKP